jgi:hypothetical protein
MSTNLQKVMRVTKQVRIDTDLHRELKNMAFQRGILITALLDQIIENYFSIQNKSYEKTNSK